MSSAREIRLTPEQQAAIEYRDSSLLVAASAGSGKTEVLARRCVALLTEGDAPALIEQLLVVTFTRAAAAELRVRIARMLTEEAASARSVDRRRHLRRQALLVEAADICTIDAWCARVVRQHAVEAGVDPTFGILDDLQADVIREEALGELFSWIYEAEDELAAAARAWIGCFPRPEDDVLRDLILRLHHARENLLDPEGVLGRALARCEQSETALRETAEAELREALADECAFQVEQLDALQETPAAEGVKPQLTAYQDVLADWVMRLQPAGSLASVTAEISEWKKPRKPRDASEAGAALLAEVHERWFKARLKKRWDAGVVDGFIADAPLCGRRLAVLLGLEARFSEAVARAKRASGALTFSDVLRCALHLLGEMDEAGVWQPTEIARQLREAYAYLLIDEFQDTSPIQVEILRLVTRLAPQTSNCFMVGDVKQSIYGFRQAEPRLFAGIRDAFEADGADGRVIYLSDNFRSHGGLVEVFNAWFGALFDPQLGGTPFGAQERLRASRARSEGDDEEEARVALHVIPDDIGAALGDEEDDAVVAEERIEREAQLAASLIKDALARPLLVPERGSGGETALRPVRLGDIVILLRSARHNAGLVAGALRTAGVAAVASGRESLLSSLEVQDLRNVLMLLHNRRQDVPLAAYLRSPMGGLSAEDLLRIRRGCDEGDFFAAAARYAAEGGDAACVRRLRAALERLERWREAAREEELPTLLRSILRETHHDLFARGLPNGAHRLAVLRALLDAAATFVARGQYGVGEFVQYLEQLSERELDPEAQVADDDDVVRVMTIHASKGLEYPVVFLLHAGARFNRAVLREPLHVDEAGGVGLRYTDYVRRRAVANVAFETLRRQREARDVEEELRLLYVATTRARERLFVVGHAPEDAWERNREQFGDGTLPLIARQNAGNLLTWLLQATAASGISEVGERGLSGVRVYEHDRESLKRCAAVAMPAAPDTSPGRGPAKLSSAERAWVADAERLLRTSFDTTLSRVPALLSVSEIKRLSHEYDSRAEPARDVMRVAARLREPDFGDEAGDGAAIDGREVGTAVHRFLEHADFGRLSDVVPVENELKALVERGVLTTAEAGLVDVSDVVWFGQSEVGRLLAREDVRVRRELPFVFGLPVPGYAERTIVRGVIDCLVEVDGGLVVIDYKTDMVETEAGFAERVSGYTSQIQLYSHIAAQLFGRECREAVLAFLAMRRLVRAEPGLPALDAVLGG